MNIREKVDAAERSCVDVFRKIDDIELHNTARVLDIFRNRQVAVRHFNQTTGYGYGDLGRDTLEAVYADVFRNGGRHRAPADCLGHSRAVAVPVRAALARGRAFKRHGDALRHAGRRDRHIRKRRRIPARNGRFLRAGRRWRRAAWTCPRSSGR